MSFYADLHIHSKYSRATSRQCDLEHLSLWARKKGISVLATGDFTHPAWVSELQEKLVPAEPGLFRLRGDLDQAVEGTAGIPEADPTRFMLSVEISTIYKKGDRTRKVHHVIYAPDFEHVQRIITSLSRIGNLTADGRPILGLDSRDLLEIVLEAGEGAYLVPAHIWTPWFSAMGSKSGFDSIAECYGDLAEHIFAVETGLSSDPAMNWRLASLDGYRLVSNSDAHSPAKLAREACVFDCDRDYFAMRRALETGSDYGGTIEFFPEEGKYHLDGHRKCGVCLSPEETRAHKGICPVCGKPVTVGVMHRVAELANRPEGARPDGAAPFHSLIPLTEVISEIEGVGAGSKRVTRIYESLLNRLGSELHILETVPLDDVRDASSDVLAEALDRMRRGQVIRSAGFDGEYGVIHLFEPDEITRGDRTGLLFAMEAPPKKAKPVLRERPEPFPEAIVPEPELQQPDTVGPPAPQTDIHPFLARLDPDQRAAAEVAEGPLMIIAGPGTGKTRTLTHRLAYLIDHKGVAPDKCLAITFTRRAAQEMAERLETLVPGAAGRIAVLTFHAFGLTILREQHDRAGLEADFRIASAEEKKAILQAVPGRPKKSVDRFAQEVAGWKRAGTPPSDAASAEILDRYNTALREAGLVDFEDLIALPVQILEEDSALAEAYRARFPHISIDEYQDVDALQYRLVRLLAPGNANLCVIGDPNQAIYRFRGADVGFFKRFEEDYPEAQVVRLTRSYRCSSNILDASGQVIHVQDAQARRLTALLDHSERIQIHSTRSPHAEAEFIVQSIEELLGGHSFFSLDSGRGEGHTEAELAFSDLAVLYRTDAQADALCEALARSGIPFQRRSHSRWNEMPYVQALAHAIQTESSGATVADRLRKASERLLAGDPTALLPFSGPDKEPAPEHASEIQAARALLEPLAARHDSDVSAFLDELALGVEHDLWDPRAERISLLTLHAAKGLEFDVVFIVGCEDGLLPLRWGETLSREEYDEEQRLFYVGMTRARRRLFLSRATKRPWRGRTRTMAPSPYLAEIEEHLLRHTQMKRRAIKPPAEDRQMDLFPGEG